MILPTNRRKTKIELFQHPISSSAGKKLSRYTSLILKSNNDMPQ